MPASKRRLTCPPCWHAGEATPPQPPQVLAGQFLIVINTWLSLLGATLATFATSALVEGRLDVVGHSSVLFRKGHLS